MKMKSIARKIIPGFVLSTLLVSILACGATPISQQATEVPQVPPADGLATSLPLPPPEGSSPTFTPIPVFTVVSLVSNPTEETGQSPDYTIKAQTPFFQGSEDLRVTNFNNEMTLLTQEEIARFKDNVVQVQPLPGSTGSFYDQQYKLLSPSGNLVSLKFEIMIYIQGAAHPGTHMRTVTYDLEAGKDLQLSQLFLPGSDYLERIANYCIVQLGTRNIGFESFSSGAQALQANYGNWNITAEGLMITFNEYQVAAYAAGPQEVVMPYAELQSVIDPHGPLAGFLP
jgi:hypothetical protein